MAALITAARRSSASRLSGCLQPALSHLLTSHRSGDGDAATSSPPLHPASPIFRSRHFPLPQSSGTAAQTLTLLPFGIHLAGAAPSRRGFSSSPSYPVADAGAVLRDAADAAAAPTAPSEVAWIAQDSSLSVAAVQHLIDSVHSLTGLNWWLSIAVSTVLLRSVWFALALSVRKQAYVLFQETLALMKLLNKADDEESKVEEVTFLYKHLGPVAFVTILSPYTFMVLYYGISNMVEKLPSLKEGGAFWFTDQTAPDALYIFPAITALSLMLKLEAIGCYFATWTFVALTQTIVLHQPAVKKLLFGYLDKPTCSSSDGSASPTAEESSRNVDEQKHLPQERREETHLILALIRSGISPMRNQEKTIKCVYAIQTQSC